MTTALGVRTITFKLTPSAPGDVQFATNEAASVIATRVLAQLAADGASIVSNRPNWIYVPNGVTASTFMVSQPGIGAGAFAVPIDPTMSVSQVRDAMRLAMATQLGNPLATPAARLDAFPLVGDSGIRVYAAVDQTLPTGTSNPVLMLINGEQYGGGLPASDFGVYRSGGTAFSGQGSRNNATSSVHIDDIVIVWPNAVRLCLVDKICQALLPILYLDRLEASLRLAAAVIKSLKVITKLRFEPVATC